MPDLVAQLRLQYGVDPTPSTFSLEVDQRDSMLNRPIQVQDFRVFNWYWEENEFAEFYKGRDLLRVLANGVQHVRLYAPAGIEHELHATEIPVEIKELTAFRLSNSVLASGDTAGISAFNRAILSFEDMTKVPSAVPIRVSPPQPAPPSVEFVGIKTAAVLDLIEFQNQRVGYMKYNYVTAGFETAYASRFVTTDGRTVNKPVWVPSLGGAFVLSEPATGAIVIRYPVEYRLYKVNYGMPSGVEYPALQLAWLRGDIFQFPMPPVTVMAVAPERGRVATANFEKNIYPRGSTLATWSTKGFEDAKQNTSVLFSESASTRVQRQLVDQNNPANIVIVEDKKTVTLVDEKGVRRTFRFAD